MSEKQFNHIINRIKEAAENSEFVFDENAWAKMEARLDKEDNKRRRFLLWWIVLPLFFIAAGSFYFFFNNSPSGKTTAAIKDQSITNNKSSQQKDITSLTPSSTDNQHITDSKSSQQKDIPYVTPSSTDNQHITDSKSSTQKDIASVTPSSTHSQHITDSKSSQQKNIPLVTTSPIINAKDASRKIYFSKGKMPAGQRIKQSVNNGNDITTGSVKEISKKINGAKKGKLLSKIATGEIGNADAPEPPTDKVDSMLDITSVNKFPINNKLDILKDTILKKDTLKNSIANNLSDKKNDDKKRKVNTSHFYFLGSIGADAGSVKLLSFNNSKITAKYGVGIGYQINKKFSVQTGFYASRKKYIAGPKDYTAKQGSYWSMVQIVKVDASCLVYDIPVSIRYNVLQKPTTVFYTTAGISSLIMKKEDYNYSYMSYYMPHQASKTYTGNKSLFAALNLSAGIEKKLSPYVSIQAEPSVSIPLSGVGDGSVKLYSTALLLSIKYTPYKKRK